MEFNFIPKCINVDVIFNGDFRGNYYLCEGIGVGKTKVNITKMQKEELNEPKITGGYLLSSDSLLNNKRNCFITKRGIKGRIKYPKEFDITPEQKNFYLLLFKSI